MWWLLVSTALADVDAEERWIGNDNLVIGFHADASLVNPDLDVGILWDPDGPEGEIPLGGDMIMVGYEWELWTWSYSAGDSSHSGTNLGPHGDTDMGMEWEGPWLTDAIHGLRASGSNDQIEVEIAMAVSQTTDVMWTDFTVTALVDVDDLWLGRSFDPDQDYWATSSHSTQNISGSGYAAATGTYEDRTILLLGIGSETGLGVGGVCDWCTTTSGITRESGESGTSDAQPGVAVEVGTLAAGESAHVRFVYAFGLGADDTLALGFFYLTVDDMDGDGSLSEDDCDDWDASVSPDLLEIADGLDNDCDGDVDEDTVASDDDGDGFTELDGDCDDADPLVYPGADPVPGVMNADCDGVADTGWWSGDTGSAEDTGSVEDTGTTADTGLPEDTGTAEDTGEDTSAPNHEDEHDTGEATDSDKTKDAGGCSCAAQPRTPSGLAGLCLIGLVALRRREGRA